MGQCIAPDRYNAHFVVQSGSWPNTLVSGVYSIMVRASSRCRTIETRACKISFWGYQSRSILVQLVCSEEFHSIRQYRGFCRLRDQHAGCVCSAESRNLATRHSVGQCRRLTPRSVSSNRVRTAPALISWPWRPDPRCVRAVFYVHVAYVSNSSAVRVRISKVAIYARG